MKNILWIIKHQFYDFLQIIGMRDRLRCPECKAVGTWKPHGGWLDDSRASGRRWICKWCGLYIGIPGFMTGNKNLYICKNKTIRRRAFIDPKYNCWRLPDFYDDFKLPKNAFIPKVNNDKSKHKANYWIG